MLAVTKLNHGLPNCAPNSGIQNFILLFFVAFVPVYIIYCRRFWVITIKMPNVVIFGIDPVNGTLVYNATFYLPTGSANFL
jgi:hypothetical protein